MLATCSSLDSNQRHGMENDNPEASLSVPGVKTSYSEFGWLMMSDVADFLFVYYLRPRLFSFLLILGCLVSIRGLLCVPSRL